MSNTKRPVVCIDAGHYGTYNKCPNNSAYSEAKVMWDLHLLQKQYLEQLGVDVITTRATQTKDLALGTRGKKADGCDLFISDHTNAVGSGMNESVDYVAVYHLTNDTTTVCDDLSKCFAEKIAPVIATTMGTKQGCKVLSRLSDNDKNGDGMMNDNYYGVLNGARSVEVPGVILEHSFHTNTTTVNWLLNKANLDKLARAETECIASFLLGKTATLDSVEAEKNPAPAPAPSDTAKVLYRVQVGAFGVKANAETQLKDVKAKGFTDAILVQVGKLFKVQVGAYSVRANADNMQKKLLAAGFDAFITTVGGTTVTTNTELKSVTEIAKEVIEGKWGNGADRKARLKNAGYDYTAVMTEVNRRLSK